MPNRFGDEEVSTPSASGGNRFGDTPVQDHAAQMFPSLGQATISAEPPATGIRDKMARWSQNVMDDIRHGTDITGVGTVLKHLGAHGIDYGQPEAVGEFMASLPLGALKITKGDAELLQGKLLQGGKDFIGGAMQAAQIPSAFVAPEVTGAAAKALDEAIPSAARAGEKFSAVMGAAKDVPINITSPGNVALDIQKLSESGASRPKVIGDFLKRVTDPDKGALTYEEARNFYSNATRLSADEANRLTPVMKRQVAQFTNALGESISQAAEHAGVRDTYQSAMQEYHRAMQVKAFKEGLVDIAKNKMAQAAAAAGAGAAGAYAVKEALK